MFRAAIKLAGPAALLMSVAVVAAACGGARAANPTPTPTPSPVDKDAVVIRVDWEGGFVTPGTTLGRLPLVMVMADGRVITEGPQIEIYPGPLMPNLQVRIFKPAALARLLELAKDKGLLADATYDLVGLTDAASTVLRITVDGVTATVSAYALGDGTEEGGVPLDADAKAGRAALRDFIDALTGVPETDWADEGSDYAISAMRLYASKAVIVENSELPGEQAPIDWPLADLATVGDEVGEGLGYRCQVVTGADLAKVLPLLSGANELSVFRSGDELWSLVPRPMLPGETGC